MKKAILILCITSIALSALAQNKSITVSNNPQAPAQFSNLITAINSANAGDTILVYGSTSPYTGNEQGQIILTKRLQIIGARHTLADANNLATIINAILIINPSADSTLLRGIRFPLAIVTPNNTGETKNITVENCYVGDITLQSLNGFGAAGGFKNLTVKNSIIGGNIKTSGTSPLVAQNNTFIGNIILTISISDLAPNMARFISNHILCPQNNNNNNHLNNVSGTLFQNNLFLFFNRISNNSQNNTFVNNTFVGLGIPQNNIDNVFLNNSEGPLPAMINFPSNSLALFNISTFHNPNFDYRLLDEFVGKSAASDGGEVGIYGNTGLVFSRFGESAPSLTDLRLQNFNVPAGSSNTLRFRLVPPKN